MRNYKSGLPNMKCMVIGMSLTLVSGCQGIFYDRKPRLGPAVAIIWSGRKSGRVRAGVRVRVGP